MGVDTTKILIVDNEKEICELFKDFFRFIGYESVYYTDGEKAFYDLETLEYDLLFVDLKLGPISGIDILKKSKVVHPLAEVIVVTGFGSEETVLKTIQYGASSYIQKPISFSDIRIQAEEALAKRRFNIKTHKMKELLSMSDDASAQHCETILNLDKLSTFLNLTIDLDILIDSILSGISSIIPATYYSFFLYNRMNKQMVICSSEPVGKRIMTFLESEIRTSFLNLTNEDVNDSYNVRTSLSTVVNPQDVSEPPRDLKSLFVPILIENAVHGILGVSGSPQVIQNGTKDLLRLVSNRSAYVLSNATLHRETKMLALTDGLTGLLNHRALRERLTIEFERVRRYGSYLSLIMADFDNLKMFNDTYGHPVGDEVLKKIGEIFRQESRETDVLARTGGDEFIIILPQTNVDSATILAERFRRKIQEYKFKVQGNEFNGTMTMGIATISKDTLTTVQDLLESADNALYEAKRSGKNRIATAPTKP